MAAKRIDIYNPASLIHHPAMPAKRTALFAAELTESFRMAMGAVASHKLRSALTLLGVLVGVFSIIVVMTAMRVLQSNIEKELGQLGAHTFSVQKFPALFVQGREAWMKIWRRQNITMQQVQLLKEKASLAQSIA